ncbi:hypothetical protein HA402_012773, partial [Bradysia odoriphaga]
NGKAATSQNHITSSGSALFTTRNNTRIIVQRNGLAVLPCQVKWNPSATVSWIRRRDFQLLTVGLSTYSSDDRFLVEHARHMGHWSLRIKSVRDEDKGLYECQLNLYPTVSIFVELKVVEAVADIVGAPDLHIDEGSTLRLECKLKRATENPAYVFWYHDNKMVNYDIQDGFSVSSFQTPHNHHSNGVSSSSSSPISSSNISNGNHDGSSLNAATSVAPSIPQTTFLKVPSTSVLTIQEVHFKHAGNYTCAPSNARQTSITVHVLRDKVYLDLMYIYSLQCSHAQTNIQGDSIS